MGPPAGMEAPPGAGMGKEPEVTFVTFNKVNGSMGLSIVAAKVRLLYVFCFKHDLYM